MEFTMSANETFPNQTNKSPRIIILEQITSLVFLLLLAAIVCILFLSYIPGMGHPLGMEIEVLIMLALLGASIILTSLLAILNNR
jgi:hypothetical protein